MSCGVATTSLFASFLPTRGKPLVVSLAVCFGTASYSRHAARMGSCSNLVDTELETLRAVPARAPGNPLALHKLACQRGNHGSSLAPRRRPQACFSWQTRQV